MFALRTTAEIDPNTYAETEFEALADARAVAELITADQAAEVQVVFLTAEDEEVVAYVTTPVPAGQYFAPWERIENPKHAAPCYAGWIPAYTRKRIQATCYRSLTHEGWRVHDGRTGNFRDVGNTTESRLLMKAMRLGEFL